MSCFAAESFIAKCPRTVSMASRYCPKGPSNIVYYILWPQIHNTVRPKQNLDPWAFWLLHGRLVAGCCRKGAELESSLPGHLLPGDSYLVPFWL